MDYESQSKHELIAEIERLRDQLSERELVEETMRDAHDGLTMTQRAARSGFWDWDMVTGKLTWTPEFHALFGLPQSAEPSFELWREVVHPEDRAATEANIARAVEQKTPLEAECRIILPDGKRLWIAINGTITSDDVGRPTRMSGVCLDITEQYLALIAKSEEKYRKLVELTQTGYLILDSWGVVVDANPEYVRLTGRKSLEEILGRSVVEWTAEHDQDKNARAVEECVHAGRVSQLEIDYVDEQGLETPVEINAFREGQGDSLRIVSLCRDISARRKANQALRRSETLLRDILDNSSTVVFVKDPGGRYLSVNRRFEELFHVQREAVLGKTDRDLFPLEFAKAFEEADRRALSAGQAIETEETVPQDDGIHFYISVKFPLKDEQGKYFAVGGISTDITDLKRTEQGLQKARDELELRVAERTAELTQANEELKREIVERERAEQALRESEAKYRKLHESMVDGFVYVSMDGRIAEFNHSYQTMLGYDQRELNNLTYIDITPETWHRFEQEIVEKQILPKGYSEVYEKEYRRKDGTIFPVELRTFLVEDEQGSPKGMWAIVRDITERKRTEQELKEQAAFRQSVIECAADGLCVCHEVPECPFVRFTVWNNRMIDLSGYTMDEINRRGWYQSVYPDPEVCEGAIERMARMRVGDNLVAEEWEITRKDGAKRTVAISTSVIRSADSEAHVLAVMRDVTERKQAEEERRRFEAQIRSVQKLESLGVLAGGIAHDLNNLLTGVLGNSELALLELPPDSPAGEYLTRVKTTAVRMSEIAKQMLAYSGKGRFTVAPLNLNDLVTEMAALMHVSLPKKIALDLDLIPNLPAVEADGGQLRQVIMNLIINAADSMNATGGTITLLTRVVDVDQSYPSEFPWHQELPEGHYVCLAVSDTGCGMTNEVQERIFDPFFTTKTTGRGLGLAAVQGIVRGHKGSITITSEPGQGSTFRILLPSSEKAPATDVHGSRNSSVSNAHGKTILVVDDEETVRMVAAAMLKKAGFRVLTAADGEEALRLLREHAATIDAVLLDLTMPKMDGLETFNEIRQQLPVEIPVILCSGFDEKNATRQFPSKGLADFIHKPFDFRTLSEKVAAVFGRRTMPPSGEA